MRAYLFALILLAAIGLLPVTAQAHAVLLASVPADGASLERAPPAIELRFSEPVGLVTLRLLDGGGTELPLPGHVLRDETLRIDLPPLPAARYLLSWRVTSLDSHPIGGSLRFAIGMPADEATPTPEQADPLVARLAYLFHAGDLLLVLLTAGGALAVLLLRLPSAVAAWMRPRLRLLAALGLVVVLLRLGVSGAALAGQDLASLLTAAPWQLAAGQPIGRALLLSALARFLLLAAPGSRTAMALAAAGMPGAFGLTGHVASAPPWPFMALALVTHVTVAAFWIGALPPLLRLTRLRPSLAVPALRRFSHLASAMVAVLVAMGALIALVQLGWHLSPVTTTLYGQALAIKVALVVAMLAVAATNRWWLVPALAADVPMAAVRLRSALLLDLALAVAIAGATAAMSLGPPPRVPAPAVAGATRTIHITSGGRTLLLTLQPGTTGRNRAEVVLLDAQGQPLALPELLLRWSSPALGIEKLTARLMPQGRGNYQAAAVDFPAAGRWTIGVEALIDDFTRAGFETELDLP